LLSLYVDIERFPSFVPGNPPCATIYYFVLLLFETGSNNFFRVMFYTTIPCILTYGDSEISRSQLFNNVNVSRIDLSIVCT